ncbi:Reverse transcriptase domain-containing protein [Abeliophyllum distichum]|uniref:Reverse transcriptase domain-containing protein n=1 Tax=Abeliophyllum distichum TaxID=126358 RepID=A0ABD1SBJ8_9LAMI
MMTIQAESMDVDSKKTEKEMILHKGLDPRIIGSGSLAFSVEELEPFFVNPSDPTQMLQIRNTMEIYVDDMLVKSVNAEDHSAHLREIFRIIHKYRMKLNILKCTFRVLSEKILGYMVNQRGIEANPKKIKALVDMQSLSSPKEVQRPYGEKLDTSGRLIKWSIELIQFDIFYMQRPSMKGQALADFIAEFAHIPEDLLEAKPYEKAKDFLSHFEEFELLQIPRIENSYADAPSKLACIKDSDLIRAILVEKLGRLSIDKALP